jgi:hypothetical protein
MLATNISSTGKQYDYQMPVSGYSRKSYGEERDAQCEYYISGIRLSALRISLLSVCRLSLTKRAVHYYDKGLDSSTGMRMQLR